MRQVSSSSSSSSDIGRMLVCSVLGNGGRDGVPFAFWQSAWDDWCCFHEEPLHHMIMISAPM